MAPLGHQPPQREDTPVTIPKPTPPAPWVSGFCNPSNDRDSHARCKRTLGGRPCACPHHQVESVLVQVQTLREMADSLLSVKFDGWDWESAARAIHTIRLTAQSLRLTDADLTRIVTKGWPGPWREPQEIDGIGRIEVRGGRDRKGWDHERWQHDARQAVLNSPGLAGAAGVVDAAGEIHDIGEVFELLTHLQRIHGSTAPKTTELRKVGLDPDDYATSTPGTPTVQITHHDQIGASA